MIGLLVVAQLTWAEPVDAVALANKAERATDLIERCRIQGRGCGASPDLLAEAFVTRALHALTVEGRIDYAATASARLLSPAALDEYEAVLPADASTPEPWVHGWLNPESVVVRQSPTPARVRTPLVPLAPGSLGIGLSVVNSPGMQWSHQAEIGVTVAPLRGWQIGLTGQGWRGPMDIYQPAFDDDSLTARADLGWISLSVGPVWTRPGGARIAGQLGALVGAARIASSDHQTIESRGILVQGKTDSYGIRAEAAGVHPLVPHGRLQAQWRVRVASAEEVQYAEPTLSNPKLSPDSQPYLYRVPGDSPSIAPSPTPGIAPNAVPQTPELLAGLRVQPEPSSPWIGIGAFLSWPGNAGSGQWPYNNADFHPGPGILANVGYGG